MLFHGGAIKLETSSHNHLVSSITLPFLSFETRNRPLPPAAVEDAAWDRVLLSPNSHLFSHARRVGHSTSSLPVRRSPFDGQSREEWRFFAGSNSPCILRGRGITMRASFHFKLRKNVNFNLSTGSGIHNGRHGRRLDELDDSIGAISRGVDAFLSIASISTRFLCPMPRQSHCYRAVTKTKTTRAATVVLHIASLRLLKSASVRSGSVWHV